MLNPQGRRHARLGPRRDENHPSLVPDHGPAHHGVDWSTPSMNSDVEYLTSSWSS